MARGLCRGLPVNQVLVPVPESLVSDEPSTWGLITRLAAKVAAYNLLITLNYRFGRDTFSVFNPLD
jgi:hypothetical protein